MRVEEVHVGHALREVDVLMGSASVGIAGPHVPPTAPSPESNTDNGRKPT